MSLADKTSKGQPVLYGEKWGVWPEFYPKINSTKPHVLTNTKAWPKLYLTFWAESYSPKVCLDSLNIVFLSKFATIFFLLSINSNLSRPILLENIQI